VIASGLKKNELFNVTVESHKLSNQRVILSHEPETVEDQEIIDSYGGLDNTPSYLVRLRPLLKVNDEIIAAGKDGLPMGEEYGLTFELLSPNGTEKFTSIRLPATCQP